MSVNIPVNSAADEADRRRMEVTRQLDWERRADLGQYLTPVGVARFMAGMFDELPARVALLDAGAGTGTLTAAFVEQACRSVTCPAEICATTYEVDAPMLGHLTETLKDCAAICEEAGVAFQGDVRTADFIEAATASLGGGLFRDKSLSFDAAILNPPYRKIATFSMERCLLQTVGLDATNMYAAFVALAIRLLRPSGQMVVIMPRSFCNGPYFRPFRELLLSEMTIRRVHVFESRKKAFRDDAVLQENIILHAVKAKPAGGVIRLSTGDGDAEPRLRDVDYSEVVREANGDRFIHLPTDQSDSDTAGWMAALPMTLRSLGIEVSTGRVVDFRAREFLRVDPGPDTVPLIYPCHFSSGVVEWPLSPCRKPNAIADVPESLSLMVPSGYYVLTKRFSSKEERRRVVAAVYDPSVFPFDRVGFENHVNYYHARGAGLDRDTAFGLMVFLNSTPVDRYFRQFNGHTQVNATDLRTLRYPDLESLAALGRAAAEGRTDSQEKLDEVVIEACQAITRNGDPTASAG